MLVSEKPGYAARIFLLDFRAGSIHSWRFFG
jgi:hypothetical protein